MLAAIDLGDILWSLFVIYVMVMYFIVVVVVLLDLVRSNDLAGWTKAAWVLALIVVPIVSVIAYLGVRGDGIGMRNLARAASHPASANANAYDIPPPPQPAAGHGA